jgi:hypothetical protein
VARKHTGTAAASSTDALTLAAGDSRYLPSSGVGARWQQEIMICDPLTALPNGYGQGVGGVTCDANITLNAWYVHVVDYTKAVGGSGNLGLEVYAGDRTSVGTLISTVNLPNASTGGLVTLGTPASININAILRCNVVLGTATLALGGLQVQYRGVYR